MRGYMQRRGTRRLPQSSGMAACWRLFVELGRLPNGKRERRTKTVYGSERDAAKQLRAMLCEHDAGMRGNPSQINVADFLRNWLSNRSNIEPGTREDYACVIRSHLIPAFGSVRLDRLDRQAIRGQYSRWQKEGHLRSGGGLTPASIRKIHTVLRAALQTAFDDNLLVRNVAAGIELPKLPLSDRRALTALEFAQLLKAAENTRLHIPMLLLLATGMRRGELLALRWCDTDLRAGRVVIRRAVERTTTGLRLKGPKSNRPRVVTLPRLAKEHLASFRSQQLAERTLLETEWVDNDLVFPDTLGGIWDPNNFSRAFRRCTRKAHLGGLGPHVLRHTAATEMLRQGLHPKVVAERLGHATTRMTLEIYSHMTPDLESDAAERMDATLRRALIEARRLPSGALEAS